MSYGIGDRVETPHGCGRITKIYRGMADVTLDRMTSEGIRYFTMCLPEDGGMNQPWYKWICENLDQDAGYEEPWTPNYNAWGAERALYSRQLQDANKRIHELEQELLKLREEKKAREQAIKTPSDPTVSVPLSAWNKLCAEAAKARPLAEEEPEAFPARALRFSA